MYLFLLPTFLYNPWNALFKSLLYLKTLSKHYVRNSYTTRKAMLNVRSKIFSFAAQKLKSKSILSMR